MRQRAVSYSLLVNFSFAEMAAHHGDGHGGGFPPGIAPPIHHNAGGGPVLHMAGVRDTEAHLALSVIGFFGIGFGRQTNLMRIHVIGDGYDRHWLAVFVVHSMIRSPLGYRISANFDGSLYVPFDNRAHVRDFHGRMVAFGAQIVSFFFV